MTKKEFNEKYKDWLVPGFYGLAIEDPNVIEYLDDLFKDLIKIPDFRFHQIKLKFGSCRFYSTLDTVLTYSIEERINHILKFNQK